MPEPGQGRLGRVQQGLPGGIEHQPASAAVEQRRAQLVLQQLDLLADGTVRQVQRAGGRAQVGLASDGAEGGQQLQRQAVGNWHAGKHS